MEQEYSQVLARCQARVEARLAESFTAPGLEEAMRYSLLAGGKRIRPVLTVQFCKAAGGAEEDGLEFGCGVEMLHTYSLIHDDLPCMDNDDLRRGKPTCHKAYGECTATLAGDALQAAAFRTVLSAPGPWTDPAVPGLAALSLARAAGELGMCAGQYWDTLGDGRPHTLEELTAIHTRKTGALLTAACEMGVLAARGRGAADPSCLEAARDYAGNLGMAFQIRDDVLDATSTTQALGKPAGSDEANRKTTFVTLLGVPACEKLVEDYTDRAAAALRRGSWPGDAGFLEWLARQLAWRSN
ncbi:MAG: polyprenyl synthetase family protein [Lawsonibacter sp.]|nr:polyprenyl synthetase family protein [Lawsonibacter sp.]